MLQAQISRPLKRPRRVVNLPYNSLGSLFKGRDAALVELRRRLMAGGGRAVGLAARQAIHGLGGVGKTRLAIEYAWRHAGDYKDALLFVSARSPVDLRASIAELCEPLVLNLAEWNQPEEIIRLAAVFRWLTKNPGWLLILDNADTPEAAAEVEKTHSTSNAGNVPERRLARASVRCVGLAGSSLSFGSITLSLRHCCRWLQHGFLAKRLLLRRWSVA